MLRSQAAPITVMIITAVIVILGLALISYVTGLLSSHRESQALMDLIVQIQSSTYMYVEQQMPSAAGGWVAYLGILSFNPIEPVINYYLLILPSNLTVNFTVPSVRVQLVDPPLPLANYTVRLSDINLLAQAGYMPANDYYMLPIDPEVVIYEIQYNISYGRPFLVKVETTWATPINQANAFLLVRTGTEYYEIIRVTFPTS